MGLGGVFCATFFLIFSGKLAEWVSMNVLMVVLSTLKLGLYTPIGGPIPLVPYMGSDIIAGSGYRPGVEAGIALEPAKLQTEITINGKPGTRYAYMGTGLLGLSWRNKNDLTFSAGVRYRKPDGHLGGYAGISLRLGSVLWSGK
jgi:hypothetical protein